jgi:hypothetical protein
MLCEAHAKDVGDRRAVMQNVMHDRLNTTERYARLLDHDVHDRIRAIGHRAHMQLAFDGGESEISTDQLVRAMADVVAPTVVRAVMAEISGPTRIRTSDRPVMSRLL